MIKKLPLLQQKSQNLLLPTEFSSWDRELRALSWISDSNLARSESRRLICLSTNSYVCMANWTLSSPYSFINNFKFNLISRICLNGQILDVAFEGTYLCLIKQALYLVQFLLSFVTAQAPLVTQKLVCRGVNRGHDALSSRVQVPHQRKVTLQLYWQMLQTYIAIIVKI